MRKIIKAIVNGRSQRFRGGSGRHSKRFCRACSSVRTSSLRELQIAQLTAEGQCGKTGPGACLAGQTPILAVGHHCDRDGKAAMDCRLMEGRRMTGREHP